MAILLKGKKGVGPQTIEGREAVIGTRSSCDLVVDDPMVAEHHCAFYERDGRYFVKDLGTSSGTYVEGVSAEGEAEIAGEGKINVVFGVSRFICEIDAEKGLLTCTLKEQSFFYDKKEDPLLWSRAEVEFGRFKPVRIGNWIAVGVVVLLFSLIFIDEIEEPLVEPGELASVHGMEHWTIHAREGLRALEAEGIAPDDCAACHDGWSGTPVDRCATCHQSITHQPTHPSSWEGQSCQPCHVDHRGEDPSKLIAITAEDSCDLCHGPGEDLTGTSIPLPARNDTAWVNLGYDTFPHSVHLTSTKKGPNGESLQDCETCHELAATPQLANPVEGRPRREFGKVAFETCQECHDRLGDDSLRFDVRWHGTDDPRGAGNAENCKQCHEQVNSPDLTQVARLPNATSRAGLFEYLIQPRSHEHEFETGGKACTDCHRDGAVAGVPLTDRPFLHGLHLTSTDESAATNTAMPGQCGDCHKEVLAGGASAKRLPSGAYGGPPSASCAPCHDGTAPSGRIRSNLPATVNHTQFPHDRHLDVTRPGLEKGCMSCHEIGLDSLRGTSVPTTLASAMDCASCHETHDNVGGGDCDRCHTAGDPVYSGTPLKRLWPQPNTFSHTSRGHVGPTKSGDCALCHEGTEAATRLSAVKIPSESDQSCRDCHIKQRARFHWK